MGEKKKTWVSLSQEQKWKNPKRIICQVNPNGTKTVPHDQAEFTPGFCTPRQCAGKLDMRMHTPADALIALIVLPIK